MSACIDRLGILAIVVVLVGLNGCTTPMQIIEAHRTQVAMMSRSSYEKIRPLIENIKVGDTRSKVLKIAKPREDKSQYFEVSKAGISKLLTFHNWPGVLTPFNMQGYLRTEEKLDDMHFGYLDGGMLRPRRIIIFEKEKVSKIIDVPDPLSLTKEPGVTVTEADPLSHLGKEVYEEFFLQKKDQIKTGMHLWELFSLLGANYFMTPDAQSFVVMCPSYLNYKKGVKVTRTTEGVHAVYPFGYMDGDSEVVKWEVEMLDYNVVHMRPYEG